MMPMKDSVRSRIQYYGRKLSALVTGFRVNGTCNVPRRGGLIIACNHISELDPPILGFAIPRTVAYMAKMELFTRRFSDFFLRKLNAFPVNRRGLDRDAIRTTLQLLRRNEAVVIFPEGTRSNDGRMLPVKNGISLLAVSARVPVTPAFIWGTDHLKRAVSRTGDRFSVTFGPTISSSRIMQIKKRDGNRAVAEHVMSAIAKTGVGQGLYPRDWYTAEGKEDSVQER